MRLGPLGYHDTVVIVALADSGPTPYIRIAPVTSRGQYLRATKGRDSSLSSRVLPHRNATTY